MWATRHDGLGWRIFFVAVIFRSAVSQPQRRKTDDRVCSCKRVQLKVAIDVDALGDQIAEMSAHIDAAMHRLLTAVREFDIAAGWQVQGALSCAHWLAWRVGWDLRTAQVRAITRVATAEKEEVWIEHAKHMPASQLDTLCRSYQNVQAYDQAHGSEAGAMAAAQVAAQRTVTRRTLDNGMVKFEVVVSSDEATIVWAALNAASAKAGAEPTGAESIFADQTPAELLLAPPPTAKAATSVERGQQRADAFMGIIQDRVRGNRPQRTPIEIIITVPHAGLHGPAGPSDLAMMAGGEVIDSLV